MSPEDTPQPTLETTPGDSGAEPQPSSLLTDPEMGGVLRTAWIWLTGLMLFFVALFCIMAGALAAHGVSSVIDTATGGQRRGMVEGLTWTADVAIVVASAAVAVSLVVKTVKEAFWPDKSGGGGDDAE